VASPTQRETPGTSPESAFETAMSVTQLGASPKEQKVGKKSVVLTKLKHKRDLKMKGKMPRSEG
jgi:hypothetical protein